MTRKTEWLSLNDTSMTGHVQTLQKCAWKWNLFWKLICHNKWQHPPSRTNLGPFGQRNSKYIQSQIITLNFLRFFIRIWCRKVAKRIPTFVRPWRHQQVSDCPCPASRGASPHPCPWAWDTTSAQPGTCQDWPELHCMCAHPQPSLCSPDVLTRLPRLILDLTCHLAFVWWAQSLSPTWLFCLPLGTAGWGCRKRSLPWTPLSLSILFSSHRCLSLHPDNDCK